MGMNVGYALNSEINHKANHMPISFIITIDIDIL